MGRKAVTVSSCKVDVPSPLRKHEEWGDKHSSPIGIVELIFLKTSCPKYKICKMLQWEEYDPFCFSHLLIPFQHDYHPSFPRLPAGEPRQAS